jgi:PAS domain S-box
MFHNEPFPIHILTDDQSAPSTVRDILSRLQAGETEVLVRFDDSRAILFCAEDIGILGKLPPEAVSASLEDMRSLLSPILPYSDSVEALAPDLMRLPPDLHRPIVFGRKDGSIVGYGRLAELLAFALRQRQRMETYFATLVETVTDAVTVVDETGCVICWNDVAVETYDIPKESILGRRIGEHFNPDELMVLRTLDEGRRVRNTYHRPRPGFHVLINASPIFDNSRIVGGIATEQDITQLVRLNDELMSARTIPEEHSPPKDPFTFIKGKGKLIDNAIQLGRKVADAEIPLLLLGEAGVGKHQLALAIHQASARAKQPFLTVHCGSIPASVVETELFGFQGGTFSGSREGSPGKLEQADGGTVFLSDIEHLPQDVQAKLLLFLQKQTFSRVGGSEALSARTRIIAGTNKDLGKLVEAQLFRSDLYYALSAISIALPALRDRKEDLPILVQSFARQYALQYQKPIPQIDPDVMLAFANYDWPGNINELMSIVERCLILCEEERITMEQLPPHLQKEQPKVIVPANEPIPAFGGMRILKPKNTEDEERALIEEALIRAMGNKSSAAKLLGISRGTLYNKLREFNLDY